MIKQIVHRPYFALLLLVLILIAIFFYRQHLNKAFVQQSAEEALHKIGNSWKQSTEDTVRKLDLVVDFTQRILNSSLDAGTQKIAIETFFATKLDRENNLLFQLRILNSEGQELIRADKQDRHTPAITTPDSALQNKQSRNYLLSANMASHLSEGEYFLSDITLNREYGQLDPRAIFALRFITPLSLKTKSPNLYLVANTYASDQFLAELAPEDPLLSHIALTNSGGDIIYAGSQMHLPPNPHLKDLYDNWDHIISLRNHTPWLIHPHQDATQTLLHLPISNWGLSKRIYYDRFMDVNYFYHLILSIPNEQINATSAQLYGRLPRKN